MGMMNKNREKVDASQLEIKDTVVSINRVTKVVKGGNVAGATLIGKTIAERLIGKGVTRVVFDRNGFLYHGRVKAVADAAREAGLEF